MTLNRARVRGLVWFGAWGAWGLLGLSSRKVTFSIPVPEIRHFLGTGAPRAWERWEQPRTQRRARVSGSAHCTERQGSSPPVSGAPLSPWSVRSTQRPTPAPSPGLFPCHDTPEPFFQTRAASGVAPRCDHFVTPRTP